MTEPVPESAPPLEPAHLAPAQRLAPEHKVTASALGAGFGSATAALVLGFLGRHVYHGDAPSDVATWVQIAVPGAVAFLAGWLAPHTARLRAKQEG